jgi:hypothetical protein
MAGNEYRKRYLQNRIDSGLCPQCGKPMDREGFYCSQCLKTKAQEEKLDRHFYQDNGICPRCRKNKLYGDEKNCPECVAKEYGHTLKHREENRQHYNDLHRVWSKKAYDERKEKGICTRCGKRKADTGYYTCGKCRCIDREHKRMRYGKPDRTDRYKQGLCYFCDNPIKKGYKVCEIHYQRNVELANSENTRKARQEMIEKGILY